MKQLKDQQELLKGHKGVKSRSECKSVEDLAEYYSYMTGVLTAIANSLIRDLDSAAKQASSPEIKILLKSMLQSYNSYIEEI